MAGLAPVVLLLLLLTLGLAMVAVEQMNCRAELYCAATVTATVTVIVTVIVTDLGVGDCGSGADELWGAVVHARTQAAQAAQRQRHMRPKHTSVDVRFVQNNEPQPPQEPGAPPE